MDIIEGYKRKARESVINVLSSLQQTDHEGGVQGPQAVKKQLIQELEPSAQTEGKYEEEQFQFFAKQVEVKQSKCVVCKKTSPKYTCPKCKVRYCSTEHYKSHNLFCTERFYKEEVEALMRRTRAAGEEKRKMVELLRAHGEEQGESEAQLMAETRVEEIAEGRLQEIMAALEEGREVALNENEMKCFERYLKEIEECSFEQAGPKYQSMGGQEEGQVQLFEEYVPFWTIGQGLDQYFLIGEPISIELFNTSQHKNLLQYRQQSSPLLRKELASLIQIFSFKKTSIFVTYDLVQVVYLTSLLFRAYNGEYLTNHDLVESFLFLYQEDLARTVAEGHPVKLAELALNALPTVMPFLRTRMADTEDSLLEILRSWLPFVVEDSLKIFKNKYVCLEALYRLLQMFRAVSSPKRKGMNTQLKMVKKIQFLLAFASEILYASPQNTQKLPQAFIQTNAMDLAQSILSRDKQAEQSQAAAIKAIRDEQSIKKQQKLSKFLIP